MRVPDSATGKRAKCPRCGNVQIVPATPAAVVAEAAEPEPQRNRVSHEPERREDLRKGVEPVDYEDDRPRRRRRKADDEDYERPARERGYRSREDELSCPRCAKPITLEDPECEACSYELDPEAMKQELGRLRTTRSLFQGLMFFFVMPGVLMIAACVVLLLNNYPLDLWVYAFAIGGGLLIFLGVALGALHKRFNPAWMLLGFLTIIGLFILAFVPDARRQRMKRIRQFLRADWEAKGYRTGQRPPWDTGGFPFTLLFGLLGMLAGGGVVTLFYLLFTQ
jgi:hypothetical protein